MRHTPQIPNFARTAAVLGALLLPAAGAVSAEPSALRVVTFAGTSTGEAMRAKDYDGVIAASRPHFSHYGYHDLVNLCAAYAFEGRAAEAGRACDRAVRYRPASSFSSQPDLRAERWAAYANRAVARHLAGSVNDARDDLARAAALGGEAAAVVVAHNRTVLGATAGLALAGVAP